MEKNFEIITLIVGQLQTNCYLFINKNSGETLIIDPGDDADYIERIIADNKCNPVKIIATHGHFDHIMAATELQLAYNITFFINQKDEFLVKKVRSSAKYFLGLETDPPPIINGYMEGKNKIKLGDFGLKIIETPGHTPGSVCFFLEKDKVLFSGDLLFAGGGVGRTDFSYSDATALERSLGKIFRLPKETQIFPGHGESFHLKDELSFQFACY